MDSLRPFQEVIIPPAVLGQQGNDPFCLATEHNIQMLTGSLGQRVIEKNQLKNDPSTDPALVEDVIKQIQQFESQIRGLTTKLLDTTARNWIDNRSDESAARLKHVLDAYYPHISNTSQRYLSDEFFSTPKALASRLFAVQWKERSEGIIWAAGSHENKSFYSTCKRVCLIQIPTLLISGLDNGLVRLVATICVLRFAYRQFCHLKVLTDSFVNLHVISKITNKNVLLLIKISDTFVKYLWIVNVISYSYIGYRVATLLIKEFGPVVIAYKNREAAERRKERLNTGIQNLTEALTRNNELTPQLRAQLMQQRQDLTNELNAVVSNAGGNNGQASYLAADNWSGFINALASEKEEGMNNEQANLLQEAELEARFGRFLEQVKLETCSLFFTPGLAIYWATIQATRFTRLCLKKVQEFLSTIAVHGQNEQNAIARQKAFALWLRSLGLEAPPV